MRPYPILRQKEPTPLPNKDQFTLHLYPFQTLPPFRSHLHPKFAIFELGRKFHLLLNKDVVAAKEAASFYPSLHRVRQIYTTWSVPPKGLSSFDDWMKQSDSDGDGDRQSESSSKTGYDSLRKGVKRRRTRNADEQGSPTPAGRNSEVMQMANPPLETLSHETLVELEHVYGKVGWAPENLSHWAANASMQVTS
jgi:hypothetical protein